MNISTLKLAAVKVNAINVQIIKKITVINRIMKFTQIIRRCTSFARADIVRLLRDYRDFVANVANSLLACWQLVFHNMQTLLLALLSPSSTQDQLSQM